MRLASNRSRLSNDVSLNIEASRVSEMKRSVALHIGQFLCCGGSGHWRDPAAVPDKSRARVRFKGGNPELQSAWYQGQVAKYFLFDEAPLSASGDKVPVSPIYDGFTINPGQPGGEMEFCTDPNSTQTHNVVATAPGDKAYSPLWLRVVYDSAACASVHNLETALKAQKVLAKVLLINCPIVSIEH